MALYHSKVYGIVQGVGFRPFVDRLATRHHICGSVCNKGPYVEIFAQGSDQDCAAFFTGLEAEAPERAAILKVDTEPLAAPETYTTFAIIDSAREKGDIFVSPDIATCDRCRAELFDPANRRYLHPFINCTACGPRLTILDAMPYDRERTSMKAFPMCDDCAHEYTDPESRRYDAQPVCCNDCGPELYIIGDEACRGADALTRARRTIASSGIVAIKGIGGFHLACDARNSNAVARLRQLKHRPVKPFAIMARDMAAVQRECELEPGQEAILTGHQKPIILLRRKPAPDKANTTEHQASNVQEAMPVAPADNPTAETAPAATAPQITYLIAPGNPKIGVMLPYAPVQMLLFDYPDDVQEHMPDVLVMTSGNPAGAPICRDDKGATEALSGFCDLLLSHDRAIRIRADDTVMDYLAGEPYMIRRSRGYAPLPVMLKNDWHGAVLGIGGELKNTFCVGRNSLFYPSPYVGDMSDLRTVLALKETVHRLTELLETEPTLIACDMHPRYNTTAVAEEMGLPLLPVQHHYAHILSCMAENDYSQPVIGVSFDGTGYGTDGTIWGGEILRCDYAGFTRLGSIAPFLQAGGDKASREGWRVAIALLYALSGHDQERLAALNDQLQLCPADALAAQTFMADNHINTITSTSAGRLYDATSALLGIRKASTFEGEASMYLQFAADRYARTRTAAEHLQAMQRLAADLPCTDAGPTSATASTSATATPCHLPTDQLFSQLLRARLQGTDTEQLAYTFHAGLAAMIANACVQARETTGLETVALSGGVMQNTLLMQLATQALTAHHFTVLRHHLIPPNDGGICLGQATRAMYYLNHKGE